MGISSCRSCENVGIPVYKSLGPNFAKTKIRWRLTLIICLGWQWLADCGPDRTTRPHDRCRSDRAAGRHDQVPRSLTLVMGRATRGLSGPPGSVQLYAMRAKWTISYSPDPTWNELKSWRTIFHLDVPQFVLNLLLSPGLKFNVQSLRLRI